MTLKGFWTYYSSENSPLPKGAQIYNRLTAGPDGQIWAGIYQPETKVTNDTIHYGGFAFGIMKFYRNKWKLFLPGEAGLPKAFGNIGAMACDHFGQLWLHLVPNPPTSILCCFDGRVTKTFYSGKSGLPEDMGTLTNFAFSIRDHVWAAMGLLGCYFYNGENWEKFTPNDYDMTDGWVTNVVASQNGQVWFAVQKAYSTDFVLYDSEKCQLYAQAPVGYKKARVQAMALGMDRKLWVGWGYPLSGANIGLWVTDGTGNWETFTKKNSALPENQIEDIAFDGAGRVWVVTVGGLIIFDGHESVCWGAIIPGAVHGPIAQDDVASIVSKETALEESPTCVFIGGAVTSDSQDRIWSWSHKGVSVFTEVQD